jgi:hypothetical protein
MAGPNLGAIIWSPEQAHTTKAKPPQNKDLRMPTR